MYEIPKKILSPSNSIIITSRTAQTKKSGTLAICPAPAQASSLTERGWRAKGIKEAADTRTTRARAQKLTRTTRARAHANVHANSSRASVPPPPSPFNPRSVNHLACSAQKIARFAFFGFVL